MSVQELIKVVLPPEKPLERGDDLSWDQVQKTLEIYLPEDLRDFGFSYGTGRFCRGTFLQVYNPFSEHYKAYVGFVCQLLQRIKGNDLPVPYPVFPEHQGLFPWGRDDNGDDMYWLTEGQPNQWPIILKTRDCEYERWEMPMTTFLAKVLNNEIKCLLWPKGFSKRDRKFKPTKD